MFSSVELRCPECKCALDTGEFELQCTSCSNVYNLHNGIPIMIPDRSDERKEEVKRMFTAMNQSLEENGLSRFSTFINWGYVPIGDPYPVMSKSNSLRLLNEIMDSVDLNGQTVLEVACGRGGNIHALCKTFKPKTIIGLDLTESNITFCSRNNRHEQAFYCVGDAEMLPFASGSFDIVLNIESSDLYTNIEHFLDEVHRVLKPGGVFLYADDLPSEKFRKVKAYMRELGFVIHLHRDITMNTILSCESSLNTRLKTLNDVASSDGEIMASMGAPGTALVEEMKDGRRLYLILHLVKPL
ncbi:class I SAM-dependent methyltransferase [Paenibacillus puerhi]|uniref:class I SAM-dependent methyltransferase n=1 Tax=Paenibacillus puerhi TaxID=2692622 RepID=UPI001356B02B|nr:class I SAM-dependent methyltransferase [Paenibacillus puerhi]